MTARERRMTGLQVTALFVISRNAPCPVSEVARHMLVPDSAARSAVAGLERRGYLDRQYTGHSYRGAAYVITSAGVEALAKEDELDDGDADVEFHAMMERAYELRRRRAERAAQAGQQ